MQTLHRALGVLGIGLLLVIASGLGGRISFWPVTNSQAASLTEQQLMVQVAYYQNRLELLTAENTPDIEELSDLLEKAKVQLETHTADGAAVASEIMQGFLERLYQSLETSKIDRNDYLIADIRASVTEAVEAFATNRTLRVGPSGEFATIGDALRAAKAGDTISIAAGLYEEELIIDKPGITLEGELSAMQVQLRGSITIFEDAVTIRRLTLSHSSKDGITIENASYAQLLENIFTEHPNNGVTVRGTYRYMLVEGNQITRNGMDGINLQGSQGSQIAVLSSDISDNGQSNARGVGIRIGGIKDVIVNKSVFKNNAFAASHPEYVPPPLIEHVCEYAGTNDATNFRTYKIYGSHEVILKNHPCGIPTVFCENQGPMTIIFFIKKPYPLGDDVTVQTLAPFQSARIPFPPDGHLFVRVRGGVGEATILIRATLGK